MKSARDVKVAVIDNSIDSSIYTPFDHWNSYLEVPWDSFEAKKSRFPDLNEGYTHLILTGSEATILERDRWVEEEAELIQEANRRGLSILGSCYGHQLLALALAGPEHVRRSTQPEVGWIPVEVKEKNALLGSKKTFYSFSVHFDEVTGLKDPFCVLASSEHCQIQAFGLKGKNVWGLQIHPEIDIPAARKLLQNLIGLNLKTGPLFESALKSTPRDSGLIRLIVDKFLNPPQGQ